MTEKNVKEFMDRKKRNQETSVKIAKILAENNVIFTDVDEILHMSKKYLMVTCVSENHSCF